VCTYQLFVYFFGFLIDFLMIMSVEVCFLFEKYGIIIIDFEEGFWLGYYINRLILLGGLILIFFLFQINR